MQSRGHKSGQKPSCWPRDVCWRYVPILTYYDYAEAVSAETSKIMSRSGGWFVRVSKKSLPLEEGREPNLRPQPAPQ